MKPKKIYTPQQILQQSYLFLQITEETDFAVGLARKVSSNPNMDANFILQYDDVYDNNKPHIFSTFLFHTLTQEQQKILLPASHFLQNAVQTCKQHNEFVVLAYNKTLQVGLVQPTDTHLNTTQIMAQKISEQDFASAKQITDNEEFTLLTPQDLLLCALEKRHLFHDYAMINQMISIYNQLHARTNLHQKQFDAMQHKSSNMQATLFQMKTLYPVDFFNKYKEDVYQLIKNPNDLQLALEHHNQNNKNQITISQNTQLTLQDFKDLTIAYYQELAQNNQTLFAQKMQTQKTSVLQQLQEMEQEVLTTLKQFQVQYQIITPQDNPLLQPIPKSLWQNSQDQGLSQNKNIT